jgi:lipopolysaccharide export system ATP-binding protein
MTQMTLTAENLAKSYKARQVVKDVSLTVKTGQIVGLLGPNGAGKTTTFYMVVGLVKSDKGRILIDDDDLTDDPMHLRARKGIGYLPQEASIFRKLTVYDNIMAVLQTRKELNTDQRIEQLEHLLEEFHITHIRDSQGMSLSGGERRRGEIDNKKIIQQLKNRGLGVLITDHNVRETLDVCERAYIVSQGDLIAEGTPDEILNNQQVRAVYLGEQFKL